MNLPNKITFSRFIIGLVMVYFAFSDMLIWFCVFYILALISDVLDGYFARKLKQKTKFGKKFDIIADNFIVLCLIFSLVFIRSFIVKKYLFVFLYVFVYYLVIQLTNYIMKKKFIFMRTFAANSAAIIFPFVVFSFIFFDYSFLAYLYLIMMIYSLTEKLAKNMKKKMTPNFFVLFIILVVVLFQVPLQNNYVCFSETCISVEIMDTPEQRALGLMFRDSLDEDKGMLFVFEEKSTYKFWMKNVNFPIDIIFLDEHKSIIEIFENVPPCLEEPCEVYGPEEESLYVIETVAGFSKKNNIEIGQEVEFTQ